MVCVGPQLQARGRARERGLCAGGEREEVKKESSMDIGRGCWAGWLKWRGRRATRITREHPVSQSIPQLDRPQGNWQRHRVHRGQKC